MKKYILPLVVICCSLLIAVIFRESTFVSTFAAVLVGSSIGSMLGLYLSDKNKSLKLQYFVAIMIFAVVSLGIILLR